MRSLAVPAVTSRSLYRKRLHERLVKARKKKDFSQADIAGILGITLEAYKKAEQRGALYADLIEPFALATDEDPFFILTGRPYPADDPLPKPIPIRRRA
jgi:transcriptional regulator with XRE-family HTH domain